MTLMVINFQYMILRLVNKYAYNVFFRILQRFQTLRQQVGVTGCLQFKNIEQKHVTSG